MKKLLNKALLIVFFAIASVSCESTRTAVFDQYSYQKTTELKVETSKLIDKATTPYSKNLVEIETLLLNIEKLSEYEKTNQIMKSLLQCGRFYLIKKKTF